MARKEMYTLKVDGRVVWTSNRLPYMKKIANETYSTRFYNTKWSR